MDDSFLRNNNRGVKSVSTYVRLDALKQHDAELALSDRGAPTLKRTANEDGQGQGGALKRVSRSYRYGASDTTRIRRFRIAALRH